MRDNETAKHGWAIRYLLASLAVSAVLLTAACSQKDRAADASESAAASAPSAGSRGEASQDVKGAANPKGSFLAYEHDVTIRLPASRIADNMAAVREACMAEKLGLCTVLGEDMTAGEAPFGNIKLRAEPKAIQDLVQLASTGGEIGQRSTRAEDLADAVQQTALEQQRMQLNHQKLTELLSRRDLKIEDLIALNERLAHLESGLQAAGQDAAQQQRRISTNLLTLHFAAEGVSLESSRIPQAVRGLGTIWDNSVATLITVVGTLLPWLLFFGLIWLVVRRLARRSPTRGAKPD